MFTFKGKNSDEYKIIVEHYPAFTVPKRSYSKVSVPGRSGDIIVDNGKYENVIVKYKIALDGHSAGYAAAYAMASELIGQIGYGRLEDTYDASVFRKAMIANETEIDNHLMRMGRGTLEFDCMPQRWLKTGETPVAFSAEGSITNPTSFDAKPLITVTGTGVLSVNGTIITINKNDTTITLDCEAEDAYTGVENKNGDIYIDDFPTLQPGINAIIPADKMTVEITPRWWRL